MTEERKPDQPKIENLELNKETVQELTEQEGDQARGGAMRKTSTCEGCPLTFMNGGCL